MGEVAAMSTGQRADDDVVPGVAGGRVRRRPLGCRMLVGYRWLGGARSRVPEVPTYMSRVMR